MNDHQLANIQVALMKANSAVSHLDTVCRDCPKKRGHTDCLVSQAKVKLVMASLTLSEIMEKERKAQNETKRT